MARLDAPLTDNERVAVRELIDGEIEDLLGLAGSLDDPVELERLATTLAGALADRSAPAGVPELMVESLEERPGTEGATILAAIAQLGPREVAAMAGAALKRLHDGGVKPRVPAELGNCELEQALLYGLDGADLYLLRLRRPGEGRVQVGFVVIEHEQTGGVLLDGMLTEPGDEREAERLMYRGEDVAIGDLEARPVSSEQLAHALREASARTRELERGVEPQVSVLLATLGRVLGMDPDAIHHPVVRQGSPLQVEPEDEEGFSRLSETLLEDFMGWVEETHGTDGALWRSGHYIAGAMLDWKWGFADGDLACWNRGDLEALLLEHAPRKLDTGADVIADGPDCVAGFLAFLDESELLAGDSLSSLSASCEQLRDEFAKAARDPGNWGLAKSTIAQMRSEGVDPTDQQAIDAWIEDFNSRPWEERDRVTGRAADRMAASVGVELPSEPDAPYARAGLDAARSGVAWAVGWFPPPDYEEAQERWQEVRELWCEIPHAEYCRRFEATLRGWARQGVKPALVDLRVAELIDFCDEQDIDPEESRDRFAAEKLRRGETRPWPPGRNDPCWCGSGTKYKRCCGAVAAVATHPLDARV